MREFVMTDIHGCRLTFQAMLRKINFGKTDKLFLLGDYIDRGPDSKGVIDDIMQMQESGFEVFCIRGNHEAAMSAARQSLSEAVPWWTWGGKETTASFGLHSLISIDNIEEKYWQWLDNLPFYMLHENYIMVHAGLNFQTDDPLADRENLLWIRDWYTDVDYDYLGDRFVLHGHTPREQSFIQKQAAVMEQTRYLDLDCGCYDDGAGKGQLCAFELKSRQLYFTKRIDKITWRR